MTTPVFSRRAFIAGFATILAGAAPMPPTPSSGPSIHVLKDPDCGCCNAWIEIMKDHGFTVTAEHVSGPRLMRYKAENEIPQEFSSCHTGRVEGYVIEGHVPAADIRRLLVERPNAIGLAVPGMPFGSPGMGPETKRDAYDVYLIGREGHVEVFSTYKAA